MRPGTIGCDDVLMSELPLPSELAEDTELPDVRDDELLPAGRYRLLELMSGRYELDELLLPRGGGGITGGLGAHGGAQQLGGYGGNGG
jgi:hypothetical protein